MAGSKSFYTFVWVDASIHQSQQNIDLQKQLFSVTSDFKAYEDIVSCEQFVRSVPAHHDVILIASGSFSKELVPKIHQLAQLKIVYVYCMKKEYMEAWAKNYKKIGDIFVKPDEVIHRVRSDVRALNNVQLSCSANGIFSICQNTKKTVSELNGDFIYSQLLIDVLRKLPDDESDKKELLKMLLKDAEDRKQEAEEDKKKKYDEMKLHIQSFINSYREEDSAYWYTIETNIYRQLNDAFTVQDIHKLFLFRHFIRGLYKHLEKTPYVFKEPIYRGQCMHSDEILQLRQSLGKIISVNSFFSTSEKKTKAETFLKSHPNKNIEGVLFIITPPQKLGKTKPFADISAQSVFQDEKEVLFVPGSIFYIRDVQKVNDHRYTITIELCLEDRNPVQHIYEKMRKDLGTHTDDVDLVLFGDLLYQISKYKLAEEIFIRLSKRSSSNDPKMTRVYYFLGMLAYHEEDYKKSLTYYHKGLAVMEATYSTNTVNTLELYNCIAESYRALGDYDQALEWHKKLLVICEKRPAQFPEILAHAYNNIGLIYANKKEYGEALKYHYKSLEINEKNPEANRADIARNHHNIGIGLDAMGQTREAMKHYEKCLEIQTAILPSTHISIGQTHQCIGCLHYGQKRWKDARESFTKARDIYQLAYGKNHGKFIKVEEYIKRCEDNIHKS